MNWTAISFATAGAYANELRRLVDSCAALNINIDAQVIRPRGSWANNCAYKAHYISEQLDRLKGPVVWIDADAEVVRYPHAFDVIDADFAAFRLDHPDGRKELLSGTLYFNYTPDVVKLVNRWAAECEVHPEVWDQRSLQKILPDFNMLNVHWLPESYCWIIDPYHKRDDLNGRPVIQHHQASRRFKRQMKGVFA